MASGLFIATESARRYVVFVPFQFSRLHSNRSNRVQVATVGSMNASLMVAAVSLPSLPAGSMTKAVAHAAIGFR